MVKIFKKNYTDKNRRRRLEIVESKKKMNKVGQNFGNLILEGIRMSRDLSSFRDCLIYFGL